MNQIGRRFALSEEPGCGVSCCAHGVFVGTVPLLQLRHRGSESDQWQPRAASDLNRELRECFRLPVEFDSKMDGLATVARAFNRGDLLHAQIATLHLQIPDPPPLTKAPRSAQEIIDLARQLKASGLLRADWDPTKHPRWPAGSPDSTGGQFAPVGTPAEGPATQEPSAPVIPAQITIPAPPLEIPGRIPFPPMRIPFPSQKIPFPSEVLPPPAIPNIDPRSNLRNPYPDRPECEEEWAHALEYCKRLIENRRMGTDGRRGFGRTFQQCVLGMVHEDCGGSLRS